MMMCLDLCLDRVLLLISLCCHLHIVASYTDLQDWGATALEYQSSIDNDLALTETTWIGTHNSYANADDGDFSSTTLNQANSISDQLSLGIREFTLDIHWSRKNCVSDKEVRVCHNNAGGSSTCTCYSGSSGYQKLQRVFEAFVAYLSVHTTQVLLVNLALMDNIVDNDKLNKLYDDFVGEFNNGNDYIYRPIIDFGGTTSGTSDCVDLDVTTITKQDILNSGKNIIFYSKSGCNSEISDYVFDLGSTQDLVNDYSDSSAVSSAESGSNPLYSSIFSRVKDGSTKGSHSDIKIHQSNINDFFVAGLNIFELYGFYGGSEWSNTNESVIRPSDAVWSWNEYEPSSGNGDCVIFSVNTYKFENEDCVLSSGYYAACYKIASNEWDVTSTTVVFSDANNACQTEFGNDWAFAVPKNGVQMNDLKNAVIASVNQDCWVNYENINGVWTAN